MAVRDAIRFAKEVLDGLTQEQEADPEDYVRRLGNLQADLKAEPANRRSKDALFGGRQRPPHEGACGGGAGTLLCGDCSKNQQPLLKVSTPRVSRPEADGSQSDGTFLAMLEA